MIERHLLRGILRADRADRGGIDDKLLLAVQPEQLAAQLMAEGAQAAGAEALRRAGKIEISPTCPASTSSGA